MPTADAYGQGVQIAALTDAPNASTLASNLAELAQRSVMRFTSASNRGATLTSPAEGMVTWLQDTNSLEVYDGSAWRGVFYGSTVWQTYTPSWTASVTNPALGNGALTGSYTKVGHSCHVVIMLTIGSTTNKGSGTYKFSLPVTAATVTNSCPGVLSATFSRGSTPNHGIGDSPLLNGATTTDQVWFPNPSVVGDSNVWTEAQPWPPAATNIFRIYGTYQTAS